MNYILNGKDFDLTHMKCHSCGLIFGQMPLPRLRPSDGQQKGAVLQGLYVMRDRAIERQEMSRGQVKNLVLDVHLNMTRKHLYGDSATCLVFLKKSIGFHHGQDNSEVLIFHKRLGVSPTLPDIFFA